MKIPWWVRHPRQAFNARWVCSFWDHDTRGGTWTRDSNNVVTMTPPGRCVRCGTVA